MSTPLTKKQIITLAQEFSGSATYSTSGVAALESLCQVSKDVFEEKNKEAVTAANNIIAFLLKMDESKYNYDTIKTMQISKIAKNIPRNILTLENAVNSPAFKKAHSATEFPTKAAYNLMQKIEAAIAAP